MADRILVAVFSAGGATKKVGKEIVPKEIYTAADLNWMNRESRSTFLESYDFSGKKILPFCTSGGSGVGGSDTALHKDVSGSVQWAKGVQINRPNEAEIRQWLEKAL